MMTKPSRLREHSIVTMLASWRQPLRSGCLLILLMGVMMLTGCANGLFYVPDNIDHSADFGYPVPHEEVSIVSRDGTRLDGWFLKARGTAKATVVHFHGNAENLTTHVHYVEWLPEAGYNVLVFDYRGYGRSEGSPNRQGIFEDVRAANDYARSRPDVDPQRMILFGQSLGGANAVALAGRQVLPGLRAVVAESAFSSYQRIAVEKMKQMPLLIGYLLLPFKPLLISDELSAEPVVGKISPLPLLLITGDADVTVPGSHSQRLFEAAGSPKLLWILKGAGHTEAFNRYRDQYAPRLSKFFDYALSGNAEALDPRDQAALQSQRQ
jgi:fermentation-respiration switch protein FrsA (DUF1100 family)